MFEQKVKVDTTTYEDPVSKKTHETLSTTKAYQYRINNMVNSINNPSTLKRIYDLTAYLYISDKS